MEPAETLNSIGENDVSGRARVLLVEDSPSLAAVYRGSLQKEGYETEVAETGARALEQLQSGAWDIVLLDLRLPDMSGMDVLKRIGERGFACAVIIITAHGTVDVAVEAMRHGAVDFLAKPFDATRLRVTVGNVVDKRRLANIVTRYRETFEREKFHGFVGASMPMQAVYRIIENAAPSRATVFVTGESGTGKELCAEAVHRQSPRRDGPFVALNCAAIPRDLIESEVFGHVKGAFTGAAGRRDGAATRADGGTLFLDEICEMDLDLQSKLLRFVQTGRFLRVGDTREEQVDIRIVCATNRDPFDAVKEGRFREDLYYRLNVIPIHLPPLRDRGDDVLAIAGEMLRKTASEEGKQFRGLSPAVADTFRAYSWPGNVRELENAIRNVVVLNDGDQVACEMLPAQIGPAEGRKPDGTADVSSGAGLAADARVAAEPLRVVQPSEVRPLWEEERRVIERAIDLCDGKIPKAAALLEVSPSTIYRKRAAWGAAARADLPS